MQRFAKLAAGLFGRRREPAGGLSASLEELMEQRKNLARLHQKSKLQPSDMAGEVRSAFKGRGIEMEEIREYTFGDDVRDIDWRVTARKKSPYTKVYAEEKDREIYVLLDLSPSMVFGTRKELKSVTASKAAALIGWMAQENRDRFGAVIYDGREIRTFKSRQNRAHLTAVLKKIAETGRKILSAPADEEEGGGNLSGFFPVCGQNPPEGGGTARALQAMTKLIKSRAAVFVISDFYVFGEAEKKALAALAKKGQVFCINVFDLLEELAPKNGEYMVEQNGRSLVFDSRPPAFRREYQNHFAAKKTMLREFCRRFNCRYMEVRTDVDIFRQLKFI